MAKSAKGSKTQTPADAPQKGSKTGNDANRSGGGQTPAKSGGKQGSEGAGHGQSADR